MFSRGLGRIRAAWAKKDKIPNAPTALTNPTIKRAKTLSQRSSTAEPAPASKPSGLDQALKLILPRPSRPSKAKLKIAPSGAIVFTPAQSQESLGSSLLPAEIPSSKLTESSTARPQLTPTPDLILDTVNSLRSSSFESVRSLQPNIARVRATEYERQRKYTFLGRHPPPIQRRSTSLPRILENQRPTPSSPRQALFFGGPSNRPRPGYIKVPRFVPLEIRPNPCVPIQDPPTCALCDQGQDIKRPDVIPCEHCRQRFSLDSSRSTRGGSEVPSCNIDEERTFPVSNGMGAVKAVGNRFKAVFAKGKEDKGLENEQHAS